MSGGTRRMWQLDEEEAQRILNRVPAPATGNTQPLYRLRAEQAERILEQHEGGPQLPAKPPLPSSDTALPAPWMFAAPDAPPPTFDEADYAATDRPLKRLWRRCLSLFGRS